MSSFLSNSAQILIQIITDIIPRIIGYMFMASASPFLYSYVYAKIFGLQKYEYNLFGNIITYERKDGKLNFSLNKHE